MNSTAALARQAGMTDAQWKEAVKFDSTDWGWIIMSIGMAIGAGIVFLPVQVAWSAYGFIYSQLSSPIRLSISYSAYSSIPWPDSPRSRRLSSVISGYLGKNWGFLLGILYF